MTRRRSYSIPFPPSISAVIDDNLKRLKKSSFPLQQKREMSQDRHRPSVRRGYRGEGRE